MDRSWATEKKRMKLSISTTFRFGVEVKAWPVIREQHQSGGPHMLCWLLNPPGFQRVYANVLFDN